MTYTIVGLAYFFGLALALGCSFIGLQKVRKWHRKRSAKAREQKKQTPATKPAPEPIPLRKLDMDLQLRSPSYLFFAMHMVLKFLRFWPAMLLAIVTSSPFVTIIFALSAIVAAAGTCWLLQTELCLPILPSAVACVAVFFAGIWLTAILNGLVMRKNEHGHVLSVRIWRRIMDAPQHVRERLEWASRHYACTRFRYDTSNALVRISGLQHTHQTDTGSSYQFIDARKKTISFSVQYEAKTRLLHLYVTQAGTERALALVRVQFPRFWISDMHLNELASQVSTNIVAITRRALEAAQYTKKDTP
jgi:hypothetical protein